MFSLKYKNKMLGPLADVPPKCSTDIAVIFFFKIWLLVIQPCKVYITRNKKSSI